LDGVVGVPEGSTVWVDGVEWIVLKIDGDFVLLIKKDVDVVIPDFSPYDTSDYETSYLRQIYTNQYTSDAFPNIKANAVIPYLGDHTSKTAVSEPSGVLSVSVPGANDTYFSLSYQEALNYQTKIKLISGNRWWLRTAAVEKDGTDASHPYYKYVYYIVNTTNYASIDFFAVQLTSNYNIHSRPAVWVRTRPWSY
jgi:hypothetical protein